ncbi:MAG: hypothetical protein PHH30_01145 [Bacteroidales bacterium]|nr:hypothetical protein [Bacteroidales bacterium]
MEKNTGKTECLNYIIKRLEAKNKTIALSSIGPDGENIDQVTETPKPEIELTRGNIFVTSELHFRQKQLIAEILDLSEKQTALGRLVTARAQNKGKVIISGPSDTVWLKNVINELDKYNPDIILVDGAISRKSPGSPSVTESIILTTGAALSASINSIVKKTAFVHQLINLDVFEIPESEDLLSIERGLWAIDENNKIHDLEIKSSLLLEKSTEKLFRHGNTIFVSGILTDKLVDFARLQKNISSTTIVVKDFTKIFVSPEKYSVFLAKGGKIKVLLKAKLITVCVNPVSPEGFILDSEKLCDKLYQTLGIPIYDIKSIKL